MIKVEIVTDTSTEEIQKGVNRFLEEKSYEIKLIDIKYIATEKLVSAMIIYKK